MKTNPDGKPSARFEAVVNSRLENEGYKYLKSKSEFVQPFKYGKRILALHYNNSFGYVSNVECFVHIVFADLEKKFKKVYPKYGWTNWTIHENLHWTENSLYDDRKEAYTDKSINTAADEFFQSIKPAADNIFESIDTYEKLHAIYNADPSTFIDYVPSIRPEKRIINGLILARNFAPERYTIIKSQYGELIDKYKGSDAPKVRVEVEEGLIKLEELQGQLQLNI